MLLLFVNILCTVYIVALNLFLIIMQASCNKFIISLKSTQLEGILIRFLKTAVLDTRVFYYFIYYKRESLKEEEGKKESTLLLATTLREIRNFRLL